VTTKIQYKSELWLWQILAKDYAEYHGDLSLHLHVVKG